MYAYQCNIVDETSYNYNTMIDIDAINQQKYNYKCMSVFQSHRN